MGTRTVAVVSAAAMVAAVSGCAFVVPATMSTSGQQADGNVSSGPSISYDGRYVAYDSAAANLVPGDGNGDYDAFVRDMVTGTTERVSLTSGGAEVHGETREPELDYAGRMVAFRSTAADLVPGDTNGVQDVFVHDRHTGKTRRVSVASDGAQGDAVSSQYASPTISGNGRFVAFVSHASNLVADDTNGTADAFVYDLRTGTTELVSRAGDGTHGNRWAGGNVSISADGRSVAFDSSSSNLVAGDSNDRIDVFAHDRRTGATRRVSVASDGTQGNDDASHLGVWISGNGRFVAFRSLASNLVPGDTNGELDVFVHDRLTATTERVSVASDGSEAHGEPPSQASDASLSFDGRFVSFDAFAYDLVPGDTNYSPDTFVHDRRTRRTARVSVASDGTQGDSWTGNHLMSADGRYLAFGTVASNLFAHDANGYGYDIVVAAVQRPEIDAVHPDTLQPGDRATITVQGAWFTPDAHVAFGPGITVERTRLTSPTTLEARVRVASGAEPGSRHVDVVNPGTGAGALTGTAERLPDALTVQ
jgi:Tol biopolymer transport system component